MPMLKTIKTTFILSLMVCLGSFLHSNEKTAQEFVSFTMPKTGTHLIDPLLERISGKKEVWSGEFFPKGYIRDEKVMNSLLAAPNVVPLHWLEVPVDIGFFNDVMDHLKAKGEFLVTHTGYSQQMEKIMKKRKCKVFFVIRDPRDLIVSIINHPNQPGLDIYVQPWFRTAEVHKQINHIIIGTDWYNPLEAVYAKFLPWKDSPVGCALTYEKLIGPNGGACTKKEQLVELRKIVKALNVQMTNRELLDIFDESFGTGWTFKGGTVGKWKQYFNEENKALFKKHLGKLLIELGYEKDDNW